MKSCGALGEGRGNTGRFPSGYRGSALSFCPTGFFFTTAPSSLEGPAGEVGERGAWRGRRAPERSNGRRAGPSSCEVGYGCSRACKSVDGGVGRRRAGPSSCEAGYGCSRACKSVDGWWWADAAGGTIFLRSWLRGCSRACKSVDGWWAADAPGGSIFLRSWLRVVAALAKAWTGGGRRMHGRVHLLAKLATGCSRACKSVDGWWWVGCGGRDHLLAKLATGGSRACKSVDGWWWADAAGGTIFLRSWLRVVAALAKAWTGGGCKNPEVY